MKPSRLFLFHGTDSRASRTAVKRWERLFVEKHGDATKYVLEADEAALRDTMGRLAEYVDGRTLFDLPKLIVVKRLSTQEKAPSFAAGKAASEFLEDRLSSLDETITVAFWEEKNLPAGHPLRLFFERLEKNGLAKSSRFQLPDAARVGEYARSYLAKEGKKLSDEAAAWLSERYRRLGEDLRQRAKVKPNEEINEDERGWWLCQLLDGAALRSGEEVGKKELLAGAETIGEAVSAFDLLRSFERREWRRGADQVRRLFAGGEPDAAFSLQAALAWRLRRGGWKPSPFLPVWVAEMEIILKNFPVDGAWLAELLLARLREAASGEEKAHLLSPRALWLSQIHRS